MSDEAFLHSQKDTQRAIICPYCGSTETEFFSLFGSQLLTAQYYCRACHTPFEQLKNESVLADAARRDLVREGQGGESQQAAEMIEEIIRE